MDRFFIGLKARVGSFREGLHNRGREDGEGKVCGDKEYPGTVNIVSAVIQWGSLMHCTACPKTIARTRTDRRICISITCGRHKYGLMELSVCAVAY